MGSMYGIFAQIHHKHQPKVGPVNIPYMDPTGMVLQLVTNSDFSFFEVLEF